MSAKNYYGHFAFASLGICQGCRDHPTMETACERNTNVNILNQHIPKTIKFDEGKVGVDTAYLLRYDEKDFDRHRIVFCFQMEVWTS